MRAHLATCSDAHAEIAELGGVLPVLDASVPVVEPPAGLKARIMAAAAADLEAGAPRACRGRSARLAAAAETGVPRRAAAPPPPPPRPPARPLRRRSRAPTSEPPAARAPRPAIGCCASRRCWPSSLLGGWNLLLQGQLNTAKAYQQNVAAVLDVAAQPGLHDRDPDRGRRHRRVRPGRDQRLGRGQMAMQDLAPTSGSTVYTAWAIGGDGVPVALGDFTVGNSGTGRSTATGAPTRGWRRPGADPRARPRRDDADPADHLEGRGDRRRLTARGRPAAAGRRYPSGSTPDATVPRPSARARASPSVAAAIRLADRCHRPGNGRPRPTP